MMPRITSLALRSTSFAPLDVVRAAMLSNENLTCSNGYIVPVRRTPF